MESERSGLPGRLGGIAGFASAALLYLSLRVVHHWGPLTILLVMAWGIATIAALVFTVFALTGSGGSRRLAKLGLVCAIVSISALVVAGLAAAAGLDETPDCGGG